MGKDPRSLTLREAGFDTGLIAVLKHLGCRTVGDAARLTRRQIACLPPAICRDAFGQATYRSLNRRLGNLGLPEIPNDPEVIDLVIKFGRTSRRPWATMLPIKWVFHDFTVSALRRLGCCALGDVRRLKRCHFIGLRGCDRYIFNEVNRILKFYGLKEIPDVPAICVEHDCSNDVGTFRDRAPEPQRARREVQTLGGVL